MISLKHLSIIWCVWAMVACAPKAPVMVEWQLVDADIKAKYTEVCVTLTNTSRDTLYGDGWCILYSMMALHPTVVDSAQIEEQIVQGTLHQLRPTAFFQPLAPGEKRSFELYYHYGSLLRNSARPEMFAYLPLTGPHAAQPVDIPFVCYPLPSDNSKAWQTTYYFSSNDSIPYATGEKLYTYYQTIGDTTTTGLHLLPVPKSVEYRQGRCDIKKAIVQEQMDTTLHNEGYRLQLDGHHITINYADQAGLFYAHKTLEQLEKTGQTMVPNVTIEDAPEYSYRGLLVDICRNFLSKKELFSILETMSELKLNRLQLHLSDDEAWRLEIPSYPQLTQLGSCRGYSGTSADPLKETTCLYPQFGDACVNTGAPANGFLSRKDMIELLHFAQARYIQIIPEVDMPGHMRAAKIAMYPLLSDSAMDSRTYLSAQEFSDCVMDVTTPFAVEFMEHVVMDIASMYAEAGCEMPVVNIGGDEVPRGSLTREEHHTFMDSITTMLDRHHIQAAGWEEMAKFTSAAKTAWLVIWHHRPERLCQLIDSGYSIVMARNDHLYLDYSYANHEAEWGLNRVCDEFRTFNWHLEDDLKSEYAQVLSRVVVGTQAQLWGESLRSDKMAETYLYPKLLGFAERAWNPHSSLSLAQLSELMYAYVLPAYIKEGHPAHVPMPGVHVDSTLVVTMTTPARNARIYYTTDGTHPTEQSTVYTAPFKLKEGDISQIRAKAIYYGYESEVVKIY